MNLDGHESPYGIDRDKLKSILQQSLDQETELLRTYTITSERIHDNEELKTRLQNFAEGNAKRTRQLMDEIGRL
ncbi:hypothetical protein KP806_25825 [Paenibacillus sp. N4]|uniref:hypothetical protein n=1 Tax=Paenibacillus vietnamensis TaxID=2590547 RepID=UPI001CD0E4F2|nr:hypothetical protein [Paenibacillus vietnamensis]MCA0758480.1 hypothetical protein [Paenibacillus vietnamensis]